MLLKGKLNRNPVARLETHAIKRADVLRHLGFCIDEERTFSEHLNNISNKSIKIY